MDINHMRQCIRQARFDGFAMDNVEIQPGTRVYQLKNPAGEYIQFGQSPEHVWQNAYKNGLLPEPRETE